MFQHITRWPSTSICRKQWRSNRYYHKIWGLEDGEASGNGTYERVMAVFDCVAFSPNNLEIVSGTDRLIKIWDVTTSNDHDVVDNLEWLLSNGPSGLDMVQPLVERWFPWDMSIMTRAIENGCNRVVEWLHHQKKCPMFDNV